jgi:zinc transport system substrate-binding protein
MRYMITAALTSLLATPAMAEVPRVVTDIPPVHAFVAQVMGDLGTPELLLEKGASEHTFQLKPSQAAGLAEAGLVVWIGPELTPWLDRALESAPVSVTRLALLDVEGTLTQAYPEGAEDEAHTEGEAHAEGEAHVEGEAHAEGEAHVEGEAHAEGEEHHHDGVDPHAWLNPNNARIWLIAIAGELGQLDPENAATYTANATAAAERIDRLDTDVQAILAPVKDQPIIVFHEAFGYFAAHYGLTIAGSIAEGDAAAPGAERLAEIRAMIEGGKVACVFPETNHDPKLVDQMVDGTGARAGAPLDPVGASLEPGVDSYDALLRGMATTIAQCVTG